jgi:hypothetical protein
METVDQKAEKKVGYKNPPMHSRFQPGHAPIPGAGRPRKRPLTEAHDDLVRQELPPKFRRALIAAGAQLPRNATWADAIAFSMARKALSGDVAAAKEIGDRIEGKPPQRIELSRSEERAPELVVVYAAGMPEELLPGKSIERIIDMKPAEEKSGELVATDTPGKTKE